jgi:8-oxo-dGTP pyrophosphatase MutT (NUDIX family)
MKKEPALNSFERDSSPEEPPIAAVGGVVYRHRKGAPQLLLIRKRHGFWTLPKGRIKPGETERDALEREVREETGLGGDVEALVQQVRYTIHKAGRPRQKIVSYYVVRAGEGAIQPDAREGIEAVRWFPLQAALRRIRRKRIRAVARAARPVLEAGAPMAKPSENTENW